MAVACGIHHQRIHETPIAIALYFAGTKVPSIKPPLVSIPPCSLISWIRVVRVLVRISGSIHSCKRRLQAILGECRFCKSVYWVPVHKINGSPLNTTMGFWSNHPDFPGFAFGLGMYGVARCHCSRVRSISHITVLTYLIIVVLE